MNLAFHAYLKAAKIMSEAGCERTEENTLWECMCVLPVPEDSEGDCSPAVVIGAGHFSITDRNSRTLLTGENQT